MATLEVHDGRGRVDYGTLTRDHPVLFGTDPKCDIVLHDPEALPIHGRIRWHRDRYRVEALPEARAVEVNGRKVISASLRQGGEIRVGACRIFLISSDDGPVDFETTVVQEPPLPARPAPPPAQTTAARLLAEEVAPPSDEVEVDDPFAESLEPLLRQERARPALEAPPRPSWWRRVRSAFSGRDQVPGQERIATSPLVLGLVAALVVLIVLGLTLKGIIARTVAQRQYNRAVESLDDGDYRNAIRQFEVFLERNPEDPRAGKARVLRALAAVRQFAVGAAPSWSAALASAREMVEQVGGEEAYRDASAALAELVLRAAEGLADRAHASADPEALAEAEAAVDLHGRVAGPPAQDLQARSRLPGKLAAARAAVLKAQVRAGALAAMDAALKDRSAAETYAARDRLVSRYADLAADAEVLERLTAANELIRQAVTYDPTRRPAETAARAEWLGPPLSLVLRTTEAGASPSGPIVFALAEGLAYGLDGTTGAPLWQAPVGLSAPFPPQAVAGGEPTALVVDARHDELVRLDSRTGALMWRQELGGPVVDPPLVLGSQVIQATPGGSLLVLDLDSGELRGSLVLGRPLARTPVSDEAGQFLYVLADEAVLFVVARDPLACVAVEYLGHGPGSIPGPPARLGRFLIVPENHGPDSSRCSVFLLEDQGARLRRLQQVPVSGWSWGTPDSVGSVLWATGDRGGVAAYAVGPYESKEPFKLIARTADEGQGLGPTFVRAPTERELWVASDRSGRFDLDPDRGALNPAWTLGAAGPALAPIQVADQMAVLTQQDAEGPGVAVWGVDPADGSVTWRTVLGAPWPLDPGPSIEGDEGLTTLAPDGRRLLLSEGQLAAGGFVPQLLPSPGTAQLPAGPLRRLSDGGLAVIVPEAGGEFVLVAEGAGVPRRVELPAPLGAVPLLWGSDLLVPADDGRAYLIDARTGATRAEPLIPPFDPSRPVRWRTPVRLDDGAVVLADEAGTVRRLPRPEESRPRLVAAVEITLDSPLVADPASTGEAVLLATADGRVRALAGRDLSPSGAWALDAPRSLGPVAVAGGLAVVADAAGSVLGFGPDGRRFWSIRLGGVALSGPPVVAEGSVWLLDRDGRLWRRSLADGAVQDRIDLGLMPAGGPRAVGDSLVVPAARGTLRVFRRPRS